LDDDLKEARTYWKLKEEAQDRTLWRTPFGRGYGPVARQDYFLNLNANDAYDGFRGHDTVQSRSNVPEKHTVSSYQGLQNP
jgi:hypothetical protein